MDDDQREAARARLALLELMVAAQQRRHEVVDVIWSSRSEGEAEGRLRDLDLLGVQDGTPARLVLDMQMRRLTEDARSRLTQEIEDLRGLLA